MEPIWGLSSKMNEIFDFTIEKEVVKYLIFVKLKSVSLDVRYFFEIEDFTTSGNKVAYILWNLLYALFWIWISLLPTVTQKSNISLPTMESKIPTEIKSFEYATPRGFQRRFSFAICNPLGFQRDFTFKEDNKPLWGSKEISHSKKGFTFTQSSVHISKK